MSIRVRASSIRPCFAPVEGIKQGSAKTVQRRPLRGSEMTFASVKTITPRREAIAWPQTEVWSVRYSADNEACAAVL